MLSTYLTLTDFTSRIPGLPAAFDVAILRPFWQQLAEGPLYALLPRAHAYWTTPAGTVHDPLRPLIVRYMVYSLWAAYCLEGNVITTETGQVIKQRDNSDNVPGNQRTELHRKYLDLAAVAATQLTAHLHRTSSGVVGCEPTGLHLSGPRLTSLGGPGRRRF